MPYKVMVISSVHRWDDTRIFYRQATSLAKKYSVELHAPADFQKKTINDIKIFGLPRWKKETDRIKSWWTLLKRGLSSDADVIHFHDPELIPVGFLIKMIKKVKVIYDIHEHVVYDIMDKSWIPRYLRSLVKNLYILIEKICLPRFDAIIYTTPIVGERYYKIGRKVVSIENYPQLELFDNSVNVEPVHGIPTMVYLGRVKKERGVKEAIFEFREVVDKLPNARFLIIGDIVPESYDNELKKLVNDMHLEKNVSFLGFVPYDETVNYLKNASCGIVTFLPERNNMACLPNKLFEYMASGLPVIASNFKLYKDVIENSESGLTVEPENVKMLAEAIIYMLKNNDIALNMGLHAQEAFKKKYNWEAEEKKLFNLYSELLCGK
jgi:glycosyltransferase involved in cell wall biosynthesis